MPTLEKRHKSAERELFYVSTVDGMMHCVDVEDGTMLVRSDYFIILIICTSETNLGPLLNKPGGSGHFEPVASLFTLISESR